VTTRLAIALVALVAHGCSPGPSPVETAPDTIVLAESRLEVRFGGVEASRGSVVCAIFADESSFRTGDTPLRTAVLPVADGDVEWALELPPGDYAVKAYQDFDDDGQLGRNSFGVPSEPYGFSNNARGVFGPPSWSAARFELVGARLVLQIELQ
jgi:uncharacterized protein (DUF2141 family)